MILVFLMMIILRLLCNEMVWETNSLLGYRSRRKGGGGQRRFNYLSHFTFCVINLQHNFGTSVQDSYTPNVTQIDFCRKVSKQRHKREKYRLKNPGGLQIKSARHDRVFCKVGTARHNLARWAWHGFPSPPSASQDLYRFWLRRGHFWGLESLIGGVSNLGGHFPLMAHTYNTRRKRSRSGVGLLSLLVVGNLGLLSSSYYYGTRSTKVKATSCLRRRVSGGGGGGGLLLSMKRII